MADAYSAVCEDCGHGWEVSADEATREEDAPEAFWVCCPDCGSDKVFSEEEFDDDRDFPEDDDVMEEFMDPGGNSALRAETEDNPRNLPCPTCGEPNRLTPRDRQLGYQCDGCADALERGF
jgi:ssDNA-binding Zn-finger/Zn-ribbon topoisomerase 1